MDWLTPDERSALLPRLSEVLLDLDLAAPDTLLDRWLNREQLTEDSDEDESESSASGSLETTE